MYSSHEEIRDSEKKSIWTMVTNSNWWFIAIAEISLIDGRISRALYLPIDATGLDLPTRHRSWDETGDEQHERKERGKFATILRMRVQWEWNERKKGRRRDRRDVLEECSDEETHIPKERRRKI